ALVVTGRVQRVEPLVLTALAVVFAACLTLRASPWLVWPDLAFAAVLLWSAASIARRGSLLDLALADVGGRALHSLVHLAAGAAFILRPPIAARGSVRGA